MWSKFDAFVAMSAASGGQPDKGGNLPFIIVIEKEFCLQKAK